jgi:hypothetical protein
MYCQSAFEAGRSFYIAANNSSRRIEQGVMGNIGNDKVQESRALPAITNRNTKGIFHSWQWIAKMRQIVFGITKL